jgi:FHA domain
MADKRCENGHFIDESWDLCPYCPAEDAEPEIPIVRPSRFGEARPASSPEARRPPTGPVPATTASPIVPRREPTAPVQPPPMERTVAVPKVGGEAAPKRFVVGWLVGLSGPSRGESFPVRIGRNVLGRDRRSDIVVNDDQASSHHADLVFRPEERRFILMDHNSTNGTYVNEVEIEPRRDLVTKDIVRIGSHRFLFMPLCDENFYWDDEGALK